jgi:hypothetical protein
MLKAPLVLCVCGFLVLITRLDGQSTIDTYPAWVAAGMTGAAPFGEPNTATMGQTFTAPAGDIFLNSFSFWLEDSTQPGAATSPVDFAAYVMAWNGTRATGSILYQSAPQVTTNNGGAGGFAQFTFSTGGTLLTPGSQYVAFLSASNFFDGDQEGVTMGWIGDGNAYPGGDFVFANNGSSFSGLITDPSAWDGSRIGDAAFQASFAPEAVPEPATWAAAVMALIGVIFSQRHRLIRRNRREA